MRIPFSWLVLVLLLIFPTASACGKTWTLAVSDNHRFLQTTDGKPFFWLGDTGWLLPERLDRAGVRRYLRHCRQDGFNVVQMQVLNAVSSVNVYGQKSNPNGFDMSAADHSGVYSYWDHLDYIVKTARRNGIYVAMVPVWGSIVKSGKMGVDDAVSYGRFLANRYKDCPNIIWMIGGDIQGDVHPEVWEALATTIKSVDHQHLMTYHPRGRYTSARWWSRAAWIDFHVFQSGHRRYGQRMGSKDYPIPDGTEEDNWMYVDSNGLTNLWSLSSTLSPVMSISLKGSMTPTSHGGRPVTCGAMPTGVSSLAAAAIPMAITPSCRCSVPVTIPATAPMAKNHTGMMPLPLQAVIRCVTSRL